MNPRARNYRLSPPPDAPVVPGSDILLDDDGNVLLDETDTPLQEG